MWRFIMLSKLYTYLEPTYNVYHGSHIDAMFVISLSYICPIKMHYYKRIVMFKIQKLVKFVLYMSHQLKRLQGDRIRENW